MKYDWIRQTQLSGWKPEKNKHHFLQLQGKSYLRTRTYPRRAPQWSPNCPHSQLAGKETIKALLRIRSLWCLVHSVFQGRSPGVVYSLLSPPSHTYLHWWRGETQRCVKFKALTKSIAKNICSTTSATSALRAKPEIWAVPCTFSHHRSIQRLKNWCPAMLDKTGPRTEDLATGRKKGL